jgi:putative DNA methylase
VDSISTLEELRPSAAIRGILYTICERKKRATEALSYNGLVQSWPETARLARKEGVSHTEQADLFTEA